MTAWNKSFTGISTDFEYVFEKFEALGSLAYLEENDEASLEQSAQGNPHDIFARIPVGRLGWHESSFAQIIHELQSESTIDLLMGAGFANGSRRLLELFIHNVNRYHSKMSW